MTYSVVARDKEKGQLGIGVQSHYLACGSKVPWLANGVGAVATQAQANMMYGEKGLQLLATGSDPKSALLTMTASDPHSDIRQVGIVNAAGEVAAHTGKHCMGFASHVTAEGVVFLANMMANEGVPEAMADSWAATHGDHFTERILSALVAAQDAGGDIRGQQAAALKMTNGFDVRVDDNAEPLAELKRLVNYQRAYDHGDRATDLAAVGDLEGAMREYQVAKDIQPDSLEIKFWFGVMLANNGRLDEACAELATVFSHGSQWRQLLRRLIPGGQLVVDETQLQRLLAG